MADFTKTVLYTDSDGYARFRDEAIALDEGSEAVRLSAVMPASGVQLRRSPIGFRSPTHCTATSQWVFILGGAMEVGLADGSSRVFVAGEHFYSADTLPAGAVFNPEVNGHWSRQVGDEPLVTLFIKG